MPGAIGERPIPAPVPINHATFFKYLLGDDDEVDNLCSNFQLKRGVFKYIYILYIGPFILYSDTSC